MKTRLTLFLVAFSLLVGVAAQAQNNEKEAKKALEAYPAAMPGMVRHVIKLDEKINEKYLKVELVPGKKMVVDCNLHMLNGELMVQDLEGWGYTYFVFATDGQVRSTMMACDEPEEIKYVEANPFLLDYNSKLPIVVYAPADYEIKYRIWEGKDELKDSEIEKP